MAGRATDRKAKIALDHNRKASRVDVATNLAGFTLPSSLTCSEVKFPVLVKKTRRANWNAILKESDQKLKEIEEYRQSKEEPVLICNKFQNTECDYITKEVFVHLLPALLETLIKAKLWEVLYTQKSFFNGIDYMVQLLWNNNPRHPNRKYDNLHLFNMPWVREYLKEHPRPVYPKSWLWTENYAATLIQKSYRQYIVQKDEEVQEMREFWKKLKVERELPEIDTNPLLAKKFASMAHLHYIKNKMLDDKNKLPVSK